MGIIVDRDFLDLPEIEYTLEKQKGLGLSMVILLLERLQYRWHTIGLVANLGRVARQLGVQKRTLIDMMCRCPVFRVDMERGIFYAPRLRRRFKLPVSLTEEEADDVLRDGNIYLGRGEKREQKEKLSESKSRTISNHSQKSPSQVSDNQQNRTPDIYKDRYISERNIEVESNSARADERTCHAAVADAKEFKEILSSDTWLMTVGRQTGINLADNATLSTFSEWMQAYCISTEKYLGVAADVSSYAASLLRKGTKTLTEFDVYLAEHQSKPMSESFEQSTPNSSLSTTICATPTMESLSQQTSRSPSHPPCGPTTYATAGKIRVNNTSCLKNPYLAEGWQTTQCMMCAK